MTSSNSGVSELRTLQVEAEGLKSRRKESPSRKTSETKQQAEPLEDVEKKQFSQDEAIGEQSIETDNAVHDLAVQLEHILKEMEEAATERPALALLTAFAVGVIVGQLFSRR